MANNFWKRIAVHAVMSSIEKKISLPNSKLICGLFVVLSLLYGVMSFAVSYKLANIHISDMYVHAVGIIEIWNANGFAEYFKQQAYPGWHILTWLFMTLGFSIEQSAGLSSAFYAFIAALTVFFVCKMMIGSETCKQIALVFIDGIALLFVAALWFPWYTESIYYGQGSPTIWHNPTYNAVKPFALLSCVLLFQMIRKRDANIRYCIVYALLTLVCLLMKPSFFQVQAPAVFIYLVIDLIMFKNWRFVRNVAVTFLPAVVYMGFQFWVMLYSPSGGGEGISLCFFDVYRFSSKSLIISILLFLAFPIYVTAVLKKDIFRKGSPYLFLFIMVLIGFCEFSFLMENGHRMMHGNFGWGYMLSVFLYWAFTLPLFLKRSFVVKDIAKPLVAIGCALVAWHFVSGVAYYLWLVLDSTGTALL